MIKNILSFGSLMLLITGLQAQITVTSSSFPQVGDTLFTKVDNRLNTIDIGSAGGDQNWDFTTLQAPFTQATIYQEASQGENASSYPQADVVVNNNQIETYYRITDDAVTLLGGTGIIPFLSDQISTSPSFDPPLIERRSPMNFLDINLQSSDVNVTVPFDQLPSTITDQLPITPDSIRVRVNLTRNEVVDAWGTVTIPGGIYDVLRERRYQIVSTHVEAKISILPWQDITSILSGLSEQFGALLQPDTSVSYRFYNDIEKEVIATAFLDANEESVLSVEYKSDDIIDNVQSAESIRPGVYAYPNPAVIFTNFEFSNLPSGTYHLALYNLVGSKVWNRSYNIQGTSTERVDLSELNRGTYLYSLVDKNGNTLMTKRLLILRP